MRKDPTAFRERFKRWKNGERVYDNGTPITDSYDGGKDDLDSLLDAGYTGPYGTKGYTSDLVNSRIELRRQDRNNAIADRLQAAADATMLGVGLTGAGAIPATAYFGARGIGDISQGDYVGGTINTGLALIPAYSKARRSIKAVRGTNVRDYFKANPSKLSRYDMNTGEGKLLSEFWNKDVVPRMKKALSDEGAVSPDVYNNWFNKNFAQSRRIWHGTTPFKPNPQGYSEGTNAIVFADNGSLFNTPEKRYSSLAHELHHSQRSNTERFRDAHTTNSNNGYTAQEEAALNNAYQFSEGFLNKHNIRPLHEKGAANTLLRATISANNGNAIGKRLNKFIDNTSDEEITKILKSGSSYGADFVNSPTYNTKNIRKALKYVGGAAGVAYGLNKYGDGKDKEIRTSPKTKPLTSFQKSIHYKPWEDNKKIDMSIAQKDYASESDVIGTGEWPREKLYRTISPNAIIGVPGLIVEGINYLRNRPLSDRTGYIYNKGSDALWKQHLGYQRDFDEMPVTGIRFSGDYNPDGSLRLPNAEYTGIPDRAKRAIVRLINNPLFGIFDNVKIPDDGSWGQRIESFWNDYGALELYKDFAIRENNNSRILDFVDTYDFPETWWFPSINRPDGYQIEVRDTIHLPDAKPWKYDPNFTVVPKSYNKNTQNKTAKKIK